MRLERGMVTLRTRGKITTIDGSNSLTGKVMRVGGAYFDFVPDGTTSYSEFYIDEWEFELEQKANPELFEQFDALKIGETFRVSGQSMNYWIKVSAYDALYYNEYQGEHKVDNFQEYWKDADNTPSGLTRYDVANG